MCEANVDAPSHVAKPSTDTQMTTPLHGIAHKRVSIERHRVVMTSRRCDVPRGSSDVRGRGSWHVVCSPSPRRLFRQETSSGHHGGSSGTRALSWKACERWNVLLERRWRHDMPRYDRSRKHGAKRFDRRWNRVGQRNRDRRGVSAVFRRLRRWDCPIDLFRSFRCADAAWPLSRRHAVEPRQ